MYILEILGYMQYLNAHIRMHIRWGNTFSTSFCVSNGVKQGGIIAPVSFNVYMNDLSCALNPLILAGVLVVKLLII